MNKCITLYKVQICKVIHLLNAGIDAVYTFMR